MNAMLLGVDEKARYIVGTNEELKKMLDACNYHTKLSPKPSISGGGELCYQYQIKEEDSDKLHIVCIEKEQGYGICYPNFVYEVFPISSDVAHLPVELTETLNNLDTPTPDDVYDVIRDYFFEEIDLETTFSIDKTVDFLECHYGGRVVDKEEYVKFANLPEDKKTEELITDLNQVDFFNDGTPEAYVLYETGLHLDLNQMSDDEKMDIVKNDYKMIQYIDHPTIEMQKAAITQNTDALSLIKEPSIEAVAFANSLGEQSKLEKIMAAKSTEVNRLNRREIDELLENHKKWLKGKGGYCLDLRNANVSLGGAYLKGVDLCHANLSNVNLRNVNLQGADLRSVDLSYADLSHADLSNAKLSNVKLQGANLYGANLQGADLGISNLQDANLSHANLENADLNAANLTNADLSFVCLEHAYLQYACLNSTDLSCVKLNHADLSNTDLEHAKLIGADLRHVDLSNANLKHADLERVDLSNADLSRADLDGANLKKATLVRTELYHTDLNHAILSESNLKQSCLVCADLSYADLSHANLSHTDLHNADLYHTYVDYADFECANLQDIKSALEHQDDLQKSEETVTIKHRDDDFER